MSCKNMWTLSQMSLKTETMMEQMRRNAIDYTLQQYVAAARHYYETCECGDTCTTLIHELEELGANMDAVIEIDLAIRDEVEASKKKEATT